MLIPLAISASVLSVLSDGDGEADEDKATRFRMVRALGGPVEAWEMLFREMPDPGNVPGAGIVRPTGGIGGRAPGGRQGFSLQSEEGLLQMIERQTPITKLVASAKRAGNLEELYGFLVELDAVLAAFNRTTPMHLVDLDQVLSSRDLPQWSSQKQEGWVTPVAPFYYDVTVWSSYSDLAVTRRIVRLDPREDPSAWSRFRMVSAPRLQRGFSL